MLSHSKLISKYQNNHTKNNPSIFKGNKTLLPSLLQCFFQSSYNIPASQWASVRRGKVQGGNQGRKRWMTAASRGPPHKSTHILSEFYWCCGKGPVRHQGKVMVNRDSQELGSSSPWRSRSWNNTLNSMTSRKRRSQSWRLMGMNFWTWRVMVSQMPGSRSC